MTRSTDAAEQTLAPTSRIRERFPALARMHRGRSVAFFDGPGGTQVPAVVAEAMVDYLLNHNANTHWAFPTSAETDQIIRGAREALADFLNATADEIVFGPNMTTLTFHLARAIGRRLGPGDAIVVTELDHHANVDPWRALERDRGVAVLQARMIPETGELDWGDLDRLMTDHRVRMLAIGAASNALGTVNDIARATAMAREAGALSFIDAVHYAPHRLVDVAAWGCDFLACSAYKFYGPHLGVLFGRREHLETLDFPKLEPAPENAPNRAETGTQNHEGIAGAGAVVDFLASLANDAGTRRQRLRVVMDGLHARGSGLLHQLWQGLSTIEGVTLYGPPPEAPRTPTLSFTVADVGAGEVAARLAERAILASHGNFYALNVSRRLGVAAQGMVRLGCACYTTEDEIDRVIAAVHEIAPRRPGSP